MDERQEREIVWTARTLDALRAFPQRLRWTFGRALYKAQLGTRHEIAYPMKGRLRGVLELAGDHLGDTYRVYYTLKCEGRVYVLHCHKKKSKHGVGLPKHEEDLILQRLKAALADCDSGTRE